MERPSPTIFCAKTGSGYAFERPDDAGERREQRHRTISSTEEIGHDKVHLKFFLA